MHYKQLILSFISIICVLLSNVTKAQAPYKFNYQGVARDLKGNPISNKNLSLQIEVLSSIESSHADYKEIQSVITNEFGLYTLQIGAGNSKEGSMQEVNWAEGNKFIRISIDPDGGNNFQLLGTNELLSVPFALYALQSGSKNTRSGNVSTSSSGTGSTNYLTKFTAANTIYNSQLFDNGTNIGYGTTSPLAKFHLQQNQNGVQEHIRMQNASPTGAGRFTLYNDATTAGYANFTKYGTSYGGGYAGISSMYPYANLLAFGNNGIASGDGKGRFLLSSGGNIGLSLFKSGTSKLKFHADFITENVGIGGNTVPVARIHLNNTDGTIISTAFTNNTSGHTSNDGLWIQANGTAASIINKENDILQIGSNNGTAITIQPDNNVEISSQLKILGGTPGLGKVLTSDASGLASWENAVSGGNLVEINSSNFNSVSILQNSMVQVKGNILLTSNYNTLNINKCFIHGGSFSGGGSEQMEIGDYSHVSNISFNNLLINGGTWTTFVNCEFSNCNSLGFQATFINCRFNNCIAENMNADLIGGEINNCTFPRNQSIKGAEISNSIFGVSPSSGLVECNSVANCKIYSSEFTLTGDAVFNDNDCNTTHLILRKDGSTSTYLYTANLDNNRFKNLYSTASEIITIDPNNDSGYFLYTIKNNIFMLQPIDAQAINVISASGNTGYQTIYIANNHFWKGMTPVTYLSDTPVKYTSNSAILTTHPSSNGNLDVMGTNY
jgi:hypothetical protein